MRKSRLLGLSELLGVTAPEKQGSTIRFKSNGNKPYSDNNFIIKLDKIVVPFEINKPNNLNNDSKI